MTIGRREFLMKGAAAAVGAAFAGPSLANPNNFTFRVPPPAQPVPAQTRQTLNAAPAGVDPALFQRAKAALDQHVASIKHRDWIGIVDFNRHSGEERCQLVHLPSGTVESFRTTHGRGSDRNHNGYLDKFSNRPGSLATSNGAYVIANQYHGKYGLSQRMHGLDWSNSNAHARAIVMHHAWYAEPEVVAQQGKMGRSEGCFAFSKRDHWHVMNRLSDGHLLYADKRA